MVHFVLLIYLILETSVGQLYQMKLRIEAKIADDKLDSKETRGKLGLRSGMLLSLINANTEDTPEKVVKLRSAAKEILNLQL
jgi:hypothetical protein